MLNKGDKVRLIKETSYKGTFTVITPTALEWDDEAECTQVVVELIPNETDMWVDYITDFGRSPILDRFGNEVERSELKGFSLTVPKNDLEII